MTKVKRLKRKRQRAKARREPRLEQEYAITDHFIRAMSVGCMVERGHESSGVIYSKEGDRYVQYDWSSFRRDYLKQTYARCTYKKEAWIRRQLYTSIRGRYITQASIIG